MATTTIGVKIDEELRARLVAKGIRVLERPSDPAAHAAFEAEISALLGG